VLTAGVILGGLKDGLHRILEGKIESLGGEVPQDINKVSPPEWVNILGGADDDLKFLISFNFLH
jgi:hypothetical protein